MSIGRPVSRRGLVVAALAIGALGLTLTVVLAQRAAPSAAGAADHLDAPGLTPPGGDVRLDLTDVYAFRAASGKTVLVLNVNPFTKAGKQATFASGVPSVVETKRVSYWFRIDSNGDAVQDVGLKIAFGKPDGAGVQSLEVTRNGKPLIEGRTSPFGKVVVNRGAPGAIAYAGVRDDPFFFDLDGFVNILSTEPGKSFLGCKSARPDKFAGANVSSIVLELPATLLTAKGSSKIGVWATTNLGGKQVDRKGRPAIATVFIPSNPFEKDEPSQKNTYNASEPKDDRAKYRGEVVDTLTTLFSLNDAAGDDTSDDRKTIDTLAGILLPDVLTFDTASPKGFLNGRRLADDVIDAELALVTEGAATSDCVGKNDVAFPSSFPYLARPHA